LRRHVVLMALLILLFLSLTTEHVVFCVLRVLAVFWTKRNDNLLVNNNNNNNNNVVQLCTVRRARMTCSCLFAVISVSIAPYHVLWIIHYPEPFEVCAVMKDHEDVFTAFYLTESFLYRIVPVFAISTLNVFIIIRLWKITRDRKRLLAASSGRSVALTVTTTTKSTNHKSMTPAVETTELKTVNNEHNKHGM